MAKKQAAPQVYQPFRTTKEDEASLKTLIAGIEKQFGKNAIMTFDPHQDMQRFEYQLPSGSIGLDLALGPMCRRVDGRWQTGLAPGRIVEILGPEAGGKTTLTLYFIALCQAMGGRVAFIDAEHALDPYWAMKLGVRVDQLWFHQPDDGKKALELAEMLVKSDLYNVVVVDSVDALVPPEYLEGEIGDGTMGAHARLMSQSLRRMAQHMGRGSRCNLILTNQLRYKVGKAAQYGNPETTPGGQALKFYANYRIDVRRSRNKVIGEKSDGTGGQLIGHYMRAKVIKNKVAPPFREAEIPLVYGAGIDIVEELVTHCVNYQILDAGGGYYKYQNQMIAHGYENAITALRNDSRWVRFLYDQLMAKNLQQMGYAPDGTQLPGYNPQVMASAYQQFAPLTEEEKKLIEGQDTAPTE